MAYRVFWTPFSEDNFKRMLMAASEPEVLVSASKEIDRRLSGAPGSFGESREGDLRVGFIEPLGIYFEVMRDVKTVIVHDVWRTDRSESSWNQIVMQRIAIQNTRLQSKSKHSSWK